MSPFKIFLTALIVGSFVGCAPKKKDVDNEESSQNEQSQETPVTPPPQTENPPVQQPPVENPPIENPPTEVPRKAMILKEEYYVRVLHNGVLESVGVVPAGYLVSIPTASVAQNLPFRNDVGQVVTTTSGFYALARIEKRPSQANVPWTKWDDLNRLPGGLYISTRIDRIP